MKLWKVVWSMSNDGIMLSIGEDGVAREYREPYSTIECETKEDFDKLSNILKQNKEATTPILLEDWGEDYGDCLWWKFPIEEPPYCGSPLDYNFPDYVTHFTRLIVPDEPK